MPLENVPQELKFEKEVASSYLADQYYIYEASITKGAFYEDIAKRVQTAAKASGGSAMTSHIGEMQTPGLDWDGHLDNLWLIFNGSSNTPAGSYAIVMDMSEAQTSSFLGDKLALFKKIADVDFNLRVKRVIYSHNFNPNLKGSARSKILGKGEGGKPAQPELNWPEGFKAGIIFELEITLGTFTVPYRHVVAVPKGKKYSSGGNWVNAGASPSTGNEKPSHKQLTANSVKKNKTIEKIRKLSGNERKRAERKNKFVKAYEEKTNSIKSKIEAKGFSLSPITVTNKGLSLHLSVDASLTIGPLQGQVVGFQVVLDMTALEFTDWKISGIAFEISKPSFSIGGAMLFNLDFSSVSGGLAIGLANWSIMVLAAYDRVKENKGKKDELEYTSLFVFGFLGGDMVTIYNIITLNGLALTFGMNRSMLFPNDMGELPNHPIIAAVAGSPGKNNRKSDPSKDDAAKQKKKGNKQKADDEDTDSERAEKAKGNRPTGLLGIVSSIKTFVPPKRGSFFAGFGIRAKVVQLVELFLMPVVTVEMDLDADMPNISLIKIQLFGLASMTLPKGIGADLAPLNIGLAFGGELSIPVGGGEEKGIKILVGGTLTNSVIRLIPGIELELTGGFAFLRKPATNYESAFFVLTVGGYGNIVTPGAGWPTVDPVGLRFNPIDEIEISSECYFFVCAKYLGIGFDMNGRAELKKSGVSALASFSIGLNALMQFDPFYVKMEAHANFHVRLQVKKSFLPPVKKSMDVQAQVVACYGKDIEFSGTAKLHFHILFSFNVDVKWGDSTKIPAPLKWVDYVAKFVPHHTLAENEKKNIAEEIEKNFRLQIAAARLTKGLRSKIEEVLISYQDATKPADELKDLNETREVLIVHPNDFEFRLEGHFPSTAISFNGNPVLDKDGVTPESIGIQMMGVTSGMYEKKMAPTLEVHLLRIKSSTRIEIQSQTEAGTPLTKIEAQDSTEELSENELSNVQAEMIHEDVATAQWKPAKNANRVPKVDPHAADMVKNARKGVRIKPKPPAFGHRHNIPKANLAFDIYKADDLELQKPHAVKQGSKTTEKAVTDSMQSHSPDKDVLEALGIEVTHPLSHLTEIDLQAVPHLV